MEGKVKGERDVQAQRLLLDSDLCGGPEMKMPRRAHHAREAETACPHLAILVVNPDAEVTGRRILQRHISISRTAKIYAHQPKKKKPRVVSWTDKIVVKMPFVIEPKNPHDKAAQAFFLRGCIAVQMVICGQALRYAVGLGRGLFDPRESLIKVGVFAVGAADRGSKGGRVLLVLVWPTLRFSPFKENRSECEINHNPNCPCEQ